MGTISVSAERDQITNPQRERQRAGRESYSDPDFTVDRVGLFLFSK